MALRLAWGITGSGDQMPETFDVMSRVGEFVDIEITAVLSKAGEKVVRWYRLWDRLQALAKRVYVEEDANTPFVVGKLQTGRYDCFLVAPATANTVAKIAHGIADSLITNAVAQTGKTAVPVYIVPVDQREGSVVTTRPGGEELELRIRSVDIENARKLAGIEGLRVLRDYSEIEGVVRDWFINRSDAQ